MIRSLRRSVIYVPGDSEKMLRKSAAMPADVLVFNLEDGVAQSRKDVALRNVLHALGQADAADHERIVRVNSPGSEVGKRDIAAVVPLKPDGICLPKMEDAGQIREVDAMVRDLEIGHGIEPESVGLHAMIESASGVLHAAEIAAASPRMASLIFGSADYMEDVRCRPGEDRAEFMLAMQMLVLAARAAGIDAIDAPCFDIRNAELLARESSAARRLGFDGKSALHPDQLTVINGAFDATEEEIAWARKVLEELDEAEIRGKALSLLDGNLIDNPHRAAAQRILRRISKTEE
jgi:citrate lyase subunit beta/citryl-CoA lyase